MNAAATQSSKRMTCAELLRVATPWLASKGDESAKVDAETLLAHALGIRRIDVFLQFERPVSVAEQDRFRELMRRRATGEPIAYLVGRRGFGKQELEVGPGVLVPRPETELLVELALARGGAPRGRSGGEGSAAAGERVRILDVGTGSGCVAIAIAADLPSAEVVAVERSDEALAYARRNVAAILDAAAAAGASGGSSHRVDARPRVEVRAGDGFQPVAGERFDVVVANPPYVRSGDLAGLPRDVRDFEPRAALDGGEDGLSVVRAWTAPAFAVLTPGGWALFEIGAGQGTAAAEIFRDAGFDRVSVTDDLAGHPRVVAGRKPLAPSGR